MSVIESLLGMFRRDDDDDYDYEAEAAARAADLDGPLFDPESGEWRSGVRHPRLRPLEWTAEEPHKPAFRHVRLPGADGHTIVQVAEDERGVLVWGMPRVDWQPVAGSCVEWGSCDIPSPDNHKPPEAKPVGKLGFGRTPNKRKPYER